MKMTWHMQVMTLSQFQRNIALLFLKDTSVIILILSKDELIACDELIKIVKNEILNKDKTVKGFNLGTNIGKVSGQSISHCHFHLIPRRKGDVENPQGGVRSVIPSKQHYKREK